MIDPGDHGSNPRELLIRRAAAPGWIHDPTVSGEPRIYDALGEQAEWGFATPWAYRALASPLTREPMLEVAPAGVQDDDGPAAYWSALLHLMVYGLGWVRPDRGLRWWYDNGKPVTDRTLRFISQIWDADGPARLASRLAVEQQLAGREAGVQAIFTHFDHASQHSGGRGRRGCAWQVTRPPHSSSRARDRGSASARQGCRSRLGPS